VPGAVSDDLYFYGEAKWFVAGGQVGAGGEAMMAGRPGGLLILPTGNSQTSDSAGNSEPPAFAGCMVSSTPGPTAWSWRPSSARSPGCEGWKRMRDDRTFSGSQALRVPLQELLADQEEASGEGGE
jgi:hypothetical protein